MNIPSRRPLRIAWDIGLEQQCSSCGDWWPADAEFFYVRADRRRQLASVCRACTVHYQRHYNRRRRQERTNAA